MCNHLNDLDPLSLLKHFKKSQLAFISKRENDEKFIVGKLMHKILCQPINRENDREALKTIVKCIQILKEDKASIAVFPEGYTSRDGNCILSAAVCSKLPRRPMCLSWSAPFRIPNMFSATPNI